MSGNSLKPLLDIEQIKQLRARYFRWVDTKQWRLISELFTGDVVIDIDDASFIRPRNSGATWATLIALSG